MQKLLVALLAVIMFYSCSLPVYATFEDQPAAWATDAATYLRTYRLIPDELFAEYNTPIKRAEFAAMLIGIYNEACQNYYTFPNDPDPFTDMTAHRYAVEVKKASIMGIINGISTNIFGPDNNITREDAATIIHRMIKLMYPQEGVLPALAITDITKVSAYALDAVGFCLGAQIMNGTGNNMFSPKGLLTRQETMVLMRNICQHYKIIEHGREAVITQLTRMENGSHAILHDNYLYISDPGYPFSFNNTIINNTNFTLIRTPLNQSQKNQGEILFTHPDDISQYTVTHDNIFLGDRSLNRGVYSLDKNGKNIKLLYNLSKYHMSDFSYMQAEGDWLFVGMWGMLFKMRTDGTCLSIIHKDDYANPFHGEGEYIYLERVFYPPAGDSNNEISYSRISLNGDKEEFIYSNNNFNNGLSHTIYNNRLYTAIEEPGMDWSTGIPLVEIDLATKAVKQAHTISYNKSLFSDSSGVYLCSADQNITHMENISGGENITISMPQGLQGRFTNKFGEYLYYFQINQPDYTRHYYLYNINTGYLTDIYGNPITP